MIIPLEASEASTLARVMGAKSDVALD